MRFRCANFCSGYVILNTLDRGDLVPKVRGSLTPYHGWIMAISCWSLPIAGCIGSRRKVYGRLSLANRAHDGKLEIGIRLEANT